MSTAFGSMGIVPELADRLQLNGITNPTPVQKQAIPVILSGQDVIAQAQTGTGKTIAFSLPILQSIDVNKEQIQALILTPTRELAIQITSELAKLAASVGAAVLAAYGGQDVEAQIRKLKRSPHIVVATPGRLLDHMRRGTVSLGKIKYLVLDEADQMLHMGFLPEVENIIDQTPKARQTMLFSATMPDAVRRLATQYMKVPVDIRIQSANVTLDNIKQFVVDTTDRRKQGDLIHLIEQQRPYLAVIFCRTKVRAKKLNEALQDHGIESDELHGDLTQAKREQVMKRFREARLQVLIATDVAARGLDVEGVTHVFNYDVPQDGESYIHRIGRTGRAGQKGTAITLATPYDRGTLMHIERSIDARLEHRTIEDDGTVRSVRVQGAERSSAGKQERNRDGGGSKERFSGYGNKRDNQRKGNVPKGAGRDKQAEGGTRGNKASGNEADAQWSNKSRPARTGTPRSNGTNNTRSSSRNAEQAGNPWEVGKQEASPNRSRGGHGASRSSSGRSSGNAERKTSSTARSGSSRSGAPRSGSARSGGESRGRNGGGRSGSTRGRR